MKPVFNKPVLDAIDKLTADLALNEGQRCVIRDAMQELYVTTYALGAESIRRSPDYNYREDMGR